MAAVRRSARRRCTIDFIVTVVRVGPSLLRAASPLAVALVLMGCPAPTGHRRGPLDQDGGACGRLEQRPVSGETCSSSGLSCEFEAPCSTRFGPTFVQTERCFCNGDRWSCGATSSCFERLPDGGVSCPIVNDPSLLSFACDERFLNRTCQLPLFQCPDGSRPPLSCTCDGNLWQCEPVQCNPTMPDGGFNPGRAGQPCMTDFDCGGLSCDTSVPGGTCTSACTNSSSVDREQAQCGGTGTTCLATSDVDAACVQACIAAQGNRPSRCRSGFVCTGLWFAQASGMPDSNGCFQFCSRDADCQPGVQCNPRTGRCGEMPENPMGLADGTPCAVSDPSACRGTCFQVSQTGSTGICGSFIDLERTRDCPDGMGVEPLTPGGDNLGLCIFRRCDESICCPRGTVCEGDGGASGFCTIDTPESPNIACSVGDAGAPDASPDASDASAPRG